MRPVNIYAEYRETAKWAFVPAEHGRWIRTHPCVLLVDCAACEARKGRPCYNLRFNDVYVFQVPVHPKRQQAYMLLRKSEPDLDDKGNVIKRRRARSA